MLTKKEQTAFFGIIDDAIKTIMQETFGKSDVKTYREKGRIISKSLAYGYKLSLTFLITHPHISAAQLDKFLRDKANEIKQS